MLFSCNIATDENLFGLATILAGGNALNPQQQENQLLLNI